MDALYTQLSMINIPFHIIGISETNHQIYKDFLVCKGTLCTFRPLRVHVVDELFMSTHS